jgi:hypothetical protein
LLQKKGVMQGLLDHFTTGTCYVKRREAEEVGGVGVSPSLQQHADDG